MRFRAILAALVLALSLAACDTNSGPAGEYSAVLFTASIDGQIVDVLNAGGDLSLTLDSDGTFAGSIFVPAELNGNGDLDESLSGTYEIEGSAVTFTSSDDTFVRDADWTLDGDRLTTNSFGIEVVLEK